MQRSVALNADVFVLVALTQQVAAIPKNMTAKGYVQLASFFRGRADAERACACGCECVDGALSMRQCCVILPEASDNVTHVK